MKHMDIPESIHAIIKAYAGALHLFYGTAVSMQEMQKDCKIYKNTKKVNQTNDEIIICIENTFLCELPVTWYLTRIIEKGRKKEKKRKVKTDTEATLCLSITAGMYTSCLSCSKISLSELPTKYLLPSFSPISLIYKSTLLLDIQSNTFSEQQKMKINK